MKEQKQLSNFSSSELSYLWISYSYESMAKYAIMAFLQHVEDEQTKELLEEGYNFTVKRTETIKDLFSKENHPIPQGFTKGDVNLDAPRLFSDALYLEFLLEILMLELTSYQLAYVESIRPDTKSYFKSNILDSMSLIEKVKQHSMEQGIFIAPPRIPIPKSNEFITKESFLAGWLGDKRPLLAMEISHLVLNAKRNGIGHAAITGFSQVAQAKEVKRFFERGRDLALKQLEVFSTILHKDDLPTAAKLWTSEVTDSTTSPFSDRLMLQLITSLIASGINSYGMAIAMSERRDLGVHYTRLLAEVALYAEDGAELLIKNGWMEQPPLAANRKKLAK